jgi:hypothetical protein
MRQRKLSGSEIAAPRIFEALFFGEDSRKGPNMKLLHTSLLLAMIVAASAAASVADAQIDGSRSLPTPGASITSSGFPHLEAKHHTAIARKNWPLNADVEYTHFNPLAPTLRIAVPFTAAPYVVGAIGERFTVAGGSAFLDSASIVIDTAIGDGFTVVAYEDTLYETSAGPMHIMNIFTEDDPFGDARIEFPQSGVTTATRFTAHFDHVPVSKNFWILVTPWTDSNGAFTSSFGVVGDRDPIVPRTADNTFSGFLALLPATGQIFSGVFDSSFYDVGGASIYSNFSISAYAETAPAAVSESLALPELRSYPNPADANVHFDLPGQFGYTVIDALGREVATGETHGTISTSALPPGAYTIILRSGERKLRSNVIVSR